MQVPTDTRRVRFGAFEADLRTCELRKHGLRIKLQDQPFQVLALLLQRPGEMVSREELRQNLWPEDTFVDFDVGLNNAIKRLREALCDSVEHPRYVETLPRKGYRFIALIESGAASGGARLAVAPAAVDVEPPSVPALKPDAEIAAPSAARSIPRWIWIIVPWFVVLLAVLVGVNPGEWRNRLLPTARAGSIHSIAVLPLQNLTGDPAQEYFADGMTDALITDLAQISGLRVISRTSVMRYKGARKPMPEIGRELNVDAVVEGSVSRSGNAVRITAQLVRTSNDVHLWAHGYNRDLSNVLVMQNEVALDIAEQVKVKLTSQEQSHLAAKHQVNPAAQEAYLKGRFFLNQGKAGDGQKAMGFFQQAIAIDPSYAPSYAGLADCYLSHPGKEFANDDDFAHTKSHAWQAINLDDTLSEPHADLGAVAFFHDGDSVEAEKQFQIAFQLNPNLANAHEWYAGSLLSKNDFDGALAHYRRAYELDPASARTNARFGLVLVIQRKYDEALPALQRAIQLDPQHWLAHNILGDAYLGKKMYAESIAEYRVAKETRGLKPDELSQMDANAAMAYALSGQRTEAQQVLSRIRKQVNCHLNLDAAGIAAALGDHKDAYEWLDKGCRSVNDVCLPTLTWHPAFDPLRGEPQFREVLRRASSTEQIHDN